MHQRLRLSIVEAEPCIWQHGEIVEAEFELYRRYTFSLLTTRSSIAQYKATIRDGRLRGGGISLTDLTLLKYSGGVCSHAKGLPLLQRFDDKLALRDMLLRIQR